MDLKSGLKICVSTKGLPPTTRSVGHMFYAAEALSAGNLDHAVAEEKFDSVRAPTPTSWNSFDYISLTIVESDVAPAVGWHFGNLAGQAMTKPLVTTFSMDDSATQKALHKGYFTLPNLEERNIMIPQDMSHLRMSGMKSAICCRVPFDPHCTERKCCIIAGCRLPPKDPEDASRRLLEAWNLASSLSKKVPRDFASVLKKAHKIAAFRYDPTTTNYQRSNFNGSEESLSGSNPVTATCRNFMETLLDEACAPTIERQPCFVLQKEALVSCPGESFDKYCTLARERLLKDCRTKSISSLVRFPWTSACRESHGHEHEREPTISMRKSRESHGRQLGPEPTIDMTESRESHGHQHPCRARSISNLDVPSFPCGEIDFDCPSSDSDDDLSESSGTVGWRLVARDPPRGLIGELPMPPRSRSRSLDMCRTSTAAQVACGPTAAGVFTKSVSQPSIGYRGRVAFPVAIPIPGRSLTASP
eukprot:jgi/Botrbrau1/8066/Bobra.13_2s0033.1